MNFFKKNKRLTLLLVLVSLILAPVFLYNGVLDAQAPGAPDEGRTSGSDLRAPGPLLAPGTPEVMISLATLNSWINNGYNNGVPDQSGYTKMAILSVQPNTDYANGHPTGAYQWEQSELRTFRSDGVLSIKQNVATQPLMDVILQKAGIDADTVVVLTGNNMQQLGLAYFNFRYWGFPRGRLRVVNGLIKDHISAGYSWDTNTPAPVGSTDTVCNEDQSTSVDELRASLAEIISVAADGDPTTIPFDVRSESEWDGTQVRSDVAFQGHIRTAVWNEWKDQTTTGTSGAPGTEIKDAASLTAIFNGIGITSADTSYIYCQTATRTGVSFLALDAVLGWRVKKVDGSWVEWGNLTDEGGTLPANSPWRTDCGVSGATACTAIPTPATVSEAVSFASTGGAVLSCPYAAAADATNENDIQICATSIQNTDCNGEIN
ncbi:MAG: rhodanese-like domain-containing protein [Thermodesulfovibrionia bacterium]